MKKFKYEFSISANSAEEADRKMKALSALPPKLTVEELEKIAQVVNNPVQLAMIKSKLL
jgi:hypothetical protein